MGSCSFFPVAALSNCIYYKFCSTHPNPAADKRIVMPTTVTRREALEKDDLAILMSTLPQLKAEHHAC